MLGIALECISDLVRDTLEAFWSMGARPWLLAPAAIAFYSQRSESSVDETSLHKWGAVFMKVVCTYLGVFVTFWLILKTPLGERASQMGVRYGAYEPNDLVHISVALTFVASILTSKTFSGKFWQFIICLCLLPSVSLVITECFYSIDPIMKGPFQPKKYPVSEYNESGLSCAMFIYFACHQIVLKIPSKGDFAMKLIYTIVIFGCGLVGFILIPDNPGRLLWLLFTIVAYPLILAILLTKKPPTWTTILEMYKIGVGNIPAIGNVLSKILTPDSHAIKQNEELKAPISEEARTNNK